MHVKLDWFKILSYFNPMIFRTQGFKKSGLFKLYKKRTKNDFPKNILLGKNFYSVDVSPSLWHFQERKNLKGNKQM